MSPFFALAPYLAHAADAQHCRLLQVTSLAMNFDSDGRPLIPVSIGGKDETVMVDTGGIYSNVTDAAAKELGLQIAVIDPALYRLAYSGKALSEKATAHDFVIGRLKLDRYDFLLLPAGGLDPTVAGILAPDILHRFDIEFDFAGGKFNVFSQDHCEGNVVYWANDYAVLPFSSDATWADEYTLASSNEYAGYALVTNATLDGKAVKVQIDTGSSVSWMTLDAARRVLGLDTASLKRLDTGKQDSDAFYTYPFKSLELQGVSVLNPNIVLTPDKLNDPYRPDIILGMTVLSKLHLYIAYGEKKIYVTGAGASSPAAH